jgi:ribosome-associated protein
MDSAEDFGKSRTQLKKEAAALQKTGEKLALLSDDQLNRMGLPTALMQAVRAVRSMKSRGARRRQMQYIGTLMRAVDVAPIEQALLEIEQGACEQARSFHRIESWRDRLVDGDDALMDEILATFTDADRQRLANLVRSARKEKEKQAPSRSARHLFRYLKQLSDGCRAQSEADSPD